MGKVKTTKTFWAYIALFAVVLIWGIAPIISNTKWVEDGYSSGMLVAFRGVFAVVTLLLMNIKKLKNFHKGYFKVAIPTGIFLSLGYICQMAGYRYTTPGKAAFLENVSVIIIPIALFILTRKKPTWTKIVAAAVCFVGASIIALEGGTEDFWKVGPGEILSMVAGVFYGLNIVVTGEYSKELDSSLYVLIQLSILTVMGFLYAFTFETFIFKGTLQYSFHPASLGLVALLGVVSTAICWALRTNCFKYISTMVVSVVMPFSAVITGIISAIISICFHVQGYDGNITWNLIVGGLVILLSIFLADLGDKIIDKIRSKKNSAPLATADEGAQLQENNNQ